MSETVAKAKKARKPFQWTDARKAAFEKCRLMRDQKLKAKVILKSSAKEAKKDEKSKVKDLLKHKEKIRQILKLMDTDDEETPEPSKPVEPPASIKKVIVKKVVKAPKKQAPVEEIIEEEEDDYDDEQGYSDDEDTYYEPPPPQQQRKYQAPPPPTPPPKQNFRYNTKTSQQAIPKEAPPAPKWPAVEPPKPTKPAFLFL